MSQTYKILSFIVLCFLLTACTSAGNNFDYTELEGKDRIDAAVEIPSEAHFLKMDNDAKSLVYASLDLIGTNAKSNKPAKDYSQIVEITSEDAYAKLLESTEEQAKIIYLGFDECPWCKAFLPKINQLASEFDVTIHYYNTRSRQVDSTFMSNMKHFGVDTVPYAFIMEDGDNKERINHMSSMQQIEDFFSQYDKKYKNNN